MKIQPRQRRVLSMNKNELKISVNITCNTGKILSKYVNKNYPFCSSEPNKRISKNMYTKYKRAGKRYPHFAFLFRYE